MRASQRFQLHAFRRLEGALLRRRLLQLDPRLRIELAVLGLLISGFLFWQVRVPLDGMVRARGPLAGVGVLATAAMVLALSSGVLAGIHHARRLRSGPGGPEWLALPLEHGALARHLAWESRGRALWLVVPSLGVLAAAVGLVPAGWIALFAAGFAGLARAAADLGCLVGDRIARRAVEARPGVHPLDALLAVAAPRARRRRLPAAAWRRAPAWAAIAVKDLLVTWRRGSTRRTASMPLVLGLGALLAWRLPGEPALRHFASFTMVLLAAAALAEWLVVLAGSDPFAALRVLPVGVTTVWGARFVWVAVAALLLSAGLLVAARELAPHALELFLASSAAATIAIATLGVNYGVTLFPRVDLAQRLLGLSLGLAIATSIMLPLSGWIVLLTAVLHSARRLPRWSRLEEA